MGNTASCRFIPLLVTNAPLYLMKYKECDIDHNGQLAHLSDVKQINWIGLNFSEDLYWGNGLKKRIEGEDGTHLKTVFCVSVAKLVEFVEMFCSKTMSSQISQSFVAC